MANANEVYVFVTAQGWTDHLQDRFPHAISVSENYRMIQFIKSNEQAMVEFARSLGFTEKHLNVADTITEMETLNIGPFIVYGDDVHAVIDHFNPSIQEA